MPNASVLRWPRRSVAEVAGRLLGRRVLVTRPAEQASGLIAALEAEGAAAVTVPLIAIVPVAGAAAELDAVVDRIGRSGTSPSHVVFTSANTARLVAAALRHCGRPEVLAAMTVAAVGDETAAVLCRLGIRVDVVARTFDADGVADAMIARGVAGARVWLPGAEGSRPALADRLTGAGADVEGTILYRTILPQGASAALGRVLDAATLDAITFASGSAVGHFDQANVGRRFPSAIPAVCIGPVTAARARAAGFAVVAEAGQRTAAGLAGAVAELLVGCNAGS